MPPQFRCLWKQEAMQMQRVIIIGAGAAGMLCAGEILRRRPGTDVTILEAGRKPLAKVAVTGGGRCNLTNSFEEIRSLAEAYPRGERAMKRALMAFGVDDTLGWFRERGVKMTLQEDHCWFPVSQDAMEIVDTLRRNASGARILLNTRAMKIERQEAGFRVLCQDGKVFEADVTVVTAGGMSKSSGMLDGLGITTEPPVPSLFTFKINDPIKSLMGLVIENASVCIPGTRFRAGGPLLITDWGFSGPAVLKLSSYAARFLNENEYRSPVSVNWLDMNDSQARELLLSLSGANLQKMVSSVHPDGIPSRLWSYISAKTGLSERRWAEIGKNGMNRLCQCLVNDGYAIEGRAKFKEEFVTCGGVSLGEVEWNSFESKKVPGLFFAGEVLDIDAITGGFNLQAAWSTGWCAAKGIVEKYG